MKKSLFAAALLVFAGFFLWLWVDDMRKQKALERDDAQIDETKRPPGGEIDHPLLKLFGVNKAVAAESVKAEDLRCQEGEYLLGVTPAGKIICKSFPVPEAFELKDGESIQSIGKGKIVCANAAVSSKGLKYRFGNRKAIELLPKRKRTQGKVSARCTETYQLIGCTGGVVVGEDVCVPVGVYSYPEVLITCCTIE